MLLMLGSIIAPAGAATTADSEIHVTKLVVEPNGPDMNFTVYYESSFFTRVFSIIFGAKVLQPSIEHIFVNFTNFSITGIDPSGGVAKVVVWDLSNLSDDGWYVYNGSATFASAIDVIEVHNSDGNVVTMYDANALPTISNRPPNSS